MPGPGDVLDLVRRGRATTRGGILEVTGLSRMTVAQRVDALLEARLLIEDGTHGPTGGRRPRRLVVNSDHSRLVTATVNTTHTTTALADLSGRILARDSFDVAVADGPERTLHEVARSVRRLLAHPAAGGVPLAGVGVSIPGPVDPETGRPSQPPIMPGWDAYPIPDRLTDEFGVSVVVANDADAAALGEQTVGYPDSPALCLVKVSTGIGTGIVLDGRVYAGVDGGAGDIGHVRVTDDRQARCRCGAQGCLAAVAGGRAVALALSELGIPASSGRDVGARLAAGDADAARLTQEAGRRIGEVMATVVSVLNPGVVLLGGALASTPLLAGVRETLYPRSLPRATRHLTVALATLGDDAASVGMARLLVENEFSPAAVNARLA